MRVPRVCHFGQGFAYGHALIGHEVFIAVSTAARHVYGYFNFLEIICLIFL